MRVMSVMAEILNSVQYLDKMISCNVSDEVMTEIQ